MFICVRCKDYHSDICEYTPEGKVCCYCMKHERDELKKKCDELERKCIELGRRVDTNSRF